jgi:hypothetical protein
MENDDLTYETDDTAMVLVPVPLHEASALIGKLNTSGYAAVQFNSTEDVLAAIGMEPVDAEGVDLSAMARIVKTLEPFATNDPRAGKMGIDDLVQVLANLGLTLADLAQTHKRAMPPLL